ncbi:MAG: type II toxin-antitoxin system HicB family antitoxin [Oligoflexales bacterium]|nr:type II toxin-antitoxin system HicB family antitoxin [Oligoflexales bacterium]
MKTQKFEKVSMNPEDYYAYNVMWSEEDDCFIASVLEIPNIKAHGDSHEDAMREIKTVTAFTLRLMKDEGEVIPEPLSKKNYSGKFTLRMSKETHKKLVIESTIAGVSLNSFIINKAIS